jgi:HD-like signal output (HDOD) protein
VVFIVVGVVVLCGIVAFFLLKKPAQSRPAPAPSRAPGVTPPRAQPTLPGATPGPAAASESVRSAPRGPVPAALQEFRFIRQSELESARIKELSDQLRTIPRPPSALQQLVSGDFLTHATSGALSDIVMGEPEVAAKVLAIVNSSLYGLQTPVGNIGQAVTFLGMNKVRGICLQYMLDDSFKAASPQMKKVYQGLWNESALASELCFKLAQLLKLEDAGTLVTQVVLSYLGRLAAYSLMDPQLVTAMATKGLLERSAIEQRNLGLAAAEIGGLLMQEWALPNGIINAVREIDAILVTPIVQTSTSNRSRLALCYLCSRMAEGLVNGQITDVGAFDLAAQEAVEYFYAHGYFELPPMERVSEWIRSPDVTSSIQRMLESM